MELTFWWLIPLALLLVAVAVRRAFRPNPQSDARRRPVAHADRLTALPEYQAALRRHRRWLAVAALAACTICPVHRAVGPICTKGGLPATD